MFDLPDYNDLNVQIYDNSVIKIFIFIRYMTSFNFQ